MEGCSKVFILLFFCISCFACSWVHDSSQGMNYQIADFPPGHELNQVPGGTGKNKEK